MAFIFIGILIIALGLYLISTYNYFQVALTRIQASIQEIGNQLKRQANLIPNLVESTKGYMKHEKGIFDELTAARQTIISASKDPKSMNQAIETMDKVMPQFMAIMESNPEIKADGVVTKLMEELRDTADKLMYTRRTLIDLTADFNAKLLMFPSSIIGNAFGFKPQKGLEVPTSGEHLSVTESETKDINIKL